MTTKTRPAFPLCFDTAAEFAAWWQANLRVPDHGNRVKSICEDCQVGYQAAMIREGRCAHPRAVVG